MKKTVVIGNVSVIIMDSLPGDEALFVNLERIAKLKNENPKIPLEEAVKGNAVKIINISKK